MSATLDDSVSLDNSIGAMMIGLIVSAVLHGVCLLQTFYYFNRYRDDPLYRKIMVVVLVSLDALHLCLITHAVYHYAITNHAHRGNLQLIVWSMVVEVAFTVLNGAFVQTFFTIRVYKLSHGNWIVTVIIMVLVLACASCGVAWVALAMRMKTYRELLRISSLTMTMNGLSTAIDFLISGTLVALLHSSRTGFKRSDSIINKLIIFIVNTGVITTICAIAALVSLVASPNTLIYVGFYFCIGRLYSNSFLATLNARNSMSDQIDDVNHMLVSFPQNTMMMGQPNISIRIDTTQDVSVVADKPMNKGSQSARQSSTNVNEIDAKKSEQYDDEVTKVSAI